MFRRLQKELSECRDSPMVDKIECTENMQLWECTLRGGYQFSIDVRYQSYPFHIPRLRGVPEQVECSIGEDWTPAVKMIGIIASVYHESKSHERVRKRIIMGLLRTIPMMMLWRKRATERVFHPSRMDFTSDISSLHYQNTSWHSPELPQLPR